jgi:hypothetical protein
VSNSQTELIDHCIAQLIECHECLKIETGDFQERSQSSVAIKAPES